MDAEIDIYKVNYLLHLDPNTENNGWHFLPTRSAPEY